MVPYGNHSLDTKFIDGSSWITPKLNEVMNEICLQIDGFYFGWIDLMYNTLEDLENGKNFPIVQ